jgi:4-hydroxy-tetrahydrodipicolinate reductase
MKKIKICLVGAAGRMGKEITEQLRGSSRFEATLAIVRKGTVPVFRAAQKNLNGIKAKDIDVVIDFSSPEMLQMTLRFCLREKIPLVTGVTGLSPEHVRALRTAAKKIPILHAPNMSLGVAILKAAIGLLGELKGFDFQIVEAHHRLKKDKPGGTALALHKELERVTQKRWPEPLALRLGGIIGEHKVMAVSQGEVIRLEHEALSRNVFAIGSLKAAEFLAKQGAGFYEMEDVLRGSPS